ncbi:MAG: ABC transporter ATP-binding protein [Candidatus Heimdallarchaeaceae archaeon]
MKEVLIEVKDLQKTYFAKAESLPVLRGTSFTICKAETVCLLGVSGSGKTTTLNLLAGLDRPTSGKINFEGRDVSQWTIEELYKYRLSKLGFIFQDFHLLEYMNALENVMTPLILQGKDEEIAKEMALELLMKVDLGGKAMSYPDELSSGQKQRVAIARSLAKDPLPSLLIADEPTGTLDSKTGDAVMELITNIVTENEMTMIYTTHELHIAKLADRILFLQDGKVSILSNKEIDNIESIYI